MSFSFVVDAGIVGVNCALAMQNEGLDVTVVDQ
jgi:predicted NAD/FAD-dependent oxidoreductase